MDFPRVVFRCPGKARCGRGGEGETYDQVLVENAEEHAAAVKAGYFPTLPEAMAHPSKPEPEPEKPKAKKPEPEAPDTIPKPKASTPRAPRQAQRKR